MFIFVNVKFNIRTIVMCTYFFARALVHDVFMLRLAPTIHCILTSDDNKVARFYQC